VHSLSTNQHPTSLSLLVYGPQVHPPPHPLKSNIVWMFSEQVDPWGASPSESAVHGAMDAAIHTSLPAFGTGAARDGTPWRPRGVLVTHLVEHKKAVNRIAVAGNGAFFVTASDDETSKVQCTVFDRCCYRVTAGGFSRADAGGRKQGGGGSGGWF